MAKKRFGNVTFTQIFLVVLFAFALLQIGAKLFSQFFHTADLRFGWIFSVIIIFMALALVFMFIVKKQATLEKKDFFVMVFMLAILAALFYLLPKYLPQFYSFTHAIAQVNGIMP